MTSDRGLSRPRFGVCFAAALFAIAPASSLRAADASEFDASAGQRVQTGSRKSAIGRRQIRNMSTCPRTRGKSTLATLRSPTRSCAPRSGSTFPASPTARPASSHWPVTAEKLRPSKSRSARDVGGLDGPAQRRDPGKRHPRPHGRGQDHPHRIRRVGRRGPEGARYRVRLRQRCDPCVAVGSRRRLHFRRLQRLRAQ